MKDPLPGTLRLDDSQRSSSDQWENAAIVSIEQMAEKASRPLLGSAQSTDESVLFADRAELLACLAMDWLDGTLITNWWWKGFFHGEDLSLSVINAWLDAPEFVPAAMHHLAVRGKAVPFLRLLRDSDVRASLQGLMQAFALNELSGMLDKSATMDQAESNLTMNGSEPERTHTQISDRFQPLMPESSLPAPWQGWTRESNSSELDIDRQILLGVGLMLQRAPEVLRLMSFARDVVAWRSRSHARHTSVMGIEHSTEKSCPEERGQTQKGPLDTGAETANEASNPVGAGNAPAETERRQTGSLQEVRANQQSQLIPSDPGTLRNEALRKEPIDRAGEKDTNVSIPSDGSVSARHPAVPDDEGVFTAEDLPAVRLEQTAVRQDSAQIVGLLGEEIETKFGGVFYLINLGLSLGLYGDFTSPTRPGISLSIWDFLALVGRSLAGEKIMRDPIWPLLAGLAGRHVDDPPGRGFRPGSSWRVPAHWLEAFPAQATCRWISDGGRLRVRHPAGFLIIDVPAKRINILRQVETELAPYGLLHRIRVRRGSVRQLPVEGGRVIQWLSRFAPYAHARLQRGLGINQRRDVRRLVCLHQARIVVTPARLDVEFSLEMLPIQVRLGGMDRDPGWVPAAGRFVSFQYK